MVYSLSYIIISVEDDSINIRFYYDGNVIKTRLIKPLAEELTLPVFSKSQEKALKFKYRFAVVSGGDAQEILFVVFTPESQHE